MNVLPEIPWSTTGSVLLGLLGILAVVVLGLTGWNQGKKAFGRTPPFHEELNARDKRLRQMIFASEKHLKEEQARQLALISRLEEQQAEMQRDRIRKWDELSKNISELATMVGFIRGKFSREEKS